MLIIKDLPKDETLDREQIMNKLMRTEIPKSKDNQEKALEYLQ
jgi:hypothetical protein